MLAAPNLGDSLRGFVNYFVHGRWELAGADHLLAQQQKGILHGNPLAKKNFAHFCAHTSRSPKGPAHNPWSTAQLRVHTPYTNDKTTMRDSPAANRRAEALLAHHSPPPAVATDVLADPDLAPCVLEKTGLRHAAVCKRWSLICAPRGAFARLVETAGDASSELRAAALGELKRLSGEEASSRRVDALVALLRVGGEDEKADVVATLQELARDDDESRVAIAAAGGIEVLVALARDGSERQKENAVRGCGTSL